MAGMSTQNQRPLAAVGAAPAVRWRLAGSTSVAPKQCLIEAAPVTATHEVKPFHGNGTARRPSEGSS